ncbi:MAG: FAD-binding protein [Planctomycetes bacterium]|nr:FAD-binding protein [Planctomycetota bacterium]
MNDEWKTRRVVLPFIIHHSSFLTSMADFRKPIADQSRIRDDLEGIVRGDVLFDDITRTLYSTDASLFEVRPVGVVAPRDEEDVRAVVRYAAEHEIPVVARGAGTGVAGGSLGGGLVVDLGRYLREVLEVGADTVRVQAGAVLRDVSTALAAVGRRFAPEPANAEGTVGGMLAANTCGSRVLRHGYPRDHVESLRVVLDTGEVVVTARHPRRPLPPTTTIVAQASARLEDIATSVVTLLEQNAALIEAQRPRTRFNRLGYLLHDVLTPEQIDLARLLQAAQRTIETRPVACDLLDRRLLALLRGAAPVPLAASAEAVLFVEYEADTPAEASDAARALADRLQRLDRLALRASVAAEPEEVEQLCRVRDAALPGLYALRGGARAVPFIEDVAVPLEALPAYLDGVQRILQQHEATASFLVHTAAGQVDVRPFLDLRRPEDVARLLALAEDVHSLALQLGGTVSSRHGTGLARTPWVARQYGRLYPVLQQLKAIFDPRHLLNPGKIIAEPGGQEAWPLRTGFASRFEIADFGLQNEEKIAADSSQSAISNLQSEIPEEAILPHPALGLTATGLATCLRWGEEDPRAESQLCNGCGLCRTAAPGSRMCPIFRAEPTEAATPRAKANLLRILLQEGSDMRALSTDEVRQVADLCVNCKMCAHECPAHVKVPKLMLEAKAANVGQHGLDRSDWVLARTENFARAGSALAPVVNVLLRNRPFRWALEKLFGVSRRRRLPSFARKSFLHRAARRGWTRPPAPRRPGAGPRVAYFVDVFANFNDPLIAEAVVAVLHHNGIEVYVPPGQRGCGMAPLAYGDVETARGTVLRNLRVLADLAREGYTILCSEPTAALMFRQDALDLLAGADELADAELVARQTVEWTAFVWDLLQQGRLRTDFGRLDFSVGHHIPCHLKALGGPPRGPALLALIPGLSVRTIDVSCSGMAGTFGLKAANYRVSLEAGRPMLEELARPGVLFGSTECSTCRLQMEDGAGKRTLHPAQYLALSYGLLPELAQRLREPIRELVL